MSLSKLFGALVALETAWAAIRSVDVLLRLDTFHETWPIVLISAVVWPIALGASAYVLLRPRLAESLFEAIVRSLLVWFAIAVNLLLLGGLLTRPELVLRWPV